MKIGLNIALCIVAAIAGVTAIEIVAIVNGVNGVALSTTIGAIVGMPTFAITKMVVEKKNEKENGKDG